MLADLIVAGVPGRRATEFQHYALLYEGDRRICSSLERRINMWTSQVLM